MEYIIGLLLGLAVPLFATLVGLDRDRSFYPTVLIVVASYYVLFAAMDAGGPVLGLEIAFAAGFSLVAVFGFKRKMWWVAAALVGHGIFDSVHHLFIQNPGVPPWWPGFCLAFDAAAGVWLFVRLTRPAPDGNASSRT